MGSLFVVSGLYSLLSEQLLAITLLTVSIATSTIWGNTFSVNAMGETGLVPLRTVAEVQGAKVSWEQTITIERGRNTIVLTVGQEQMIVNGVIQKLDESPIVQAGRTFISLTTLNKLLSNLVVWDD